MCKFWVVFLSASFASMANCQSNRIDIIAQAQSGTGKTGAFTISTLQIINSDEKKTQALILAPTHELANQIKSVITSLGNFLKIKIWQSCHSGIDRIHKC